MNSYCGVYVIPCRDGELRFIDQIEKPLNVWINQNKVAVRPGYANNDVFKYVRDTGLVIYLRVAKVDEWCSNLIVNSKTDILTKSMSECL